MIGTFTSKVNGSNTANAEPDSNLLTFKSFNALAGMLNNPAPSPLYKDAVNAPLIATPPLTIKLKLPDGAILSIVVYVFITRPVFGAIDAVTEPLAIRGASADNCATTFVN